MKKDKFINAIMILVIFTGFLTTASAQPLPHKNNAPQTNLYKDARQNFVNAKEKLGQIKNEKDRKALQGKAKNFLEKSISALIQRLEALKNKAENTPGIIEAEKQAILAKINKEINWLKEQLAKTNTDFNQTKQTTRIIGDYSRNFKIIVKQISGEIIASRFGVVINKAENLLSRLLIKIQELKQAGKDTTQIEILLNEANQKIASAKEKKDEGLINEARQYINEANAKIRQIVAGLKK